MTPRTEPLFLSWETKWKLKQMAAEAREYGDEKATADSCAEKILADYFAKNFAELDLVLAKRSGIDEEAQRVFTVAKLANQKEKQ